jgi:hypothetical protein
VVWAPKLEVACELLVYVSAAGGADWAIMSGATSGIERIETRILEMGRIELFLLVF